MRRLLIAALLAGVCIHMAGSDLLSDKEIQKAIDLGRATEVRAVWKSIQKNHLVRINRPAVSAFGDIVGKRAIFLNDRDLVVLAASDTSRRHHVLTIAEVRQWRSLGATHVLLVAEGSGDTDLSKWRAPAVHMTITADGREIQPLSESITESSQTEIISGENGLVSRSGNVATYTPLYQPPFGEPNFSCTWFSFNIPPGAENLTITVISKDGHEKHADFSASMLR